VYRLKGHINADGEVWFKRTYIGPADGGIVREDTNPSSFRGVMTPFGIVGVWHIDYVWRAGKRPFLSGFFWLWRKDWCPDLEA
jgi:hypothetical protein